LNDGFPRASGGTATFLHIISCSRLLEVLREDNRAVVRAASAASKAADYLLAFRQGAGLALDTEQEAA